MAHAVGLKRSEGGAVSTGFIGSDEFFICCFRFLVMAIGTPFVLFETARAEFGAAARAMFHAGAAVILLAACAARHTRAAKEAFAAGATDIAIATDVCATQFTGPPLIVTDGRTTVGALHTVPIRERHVRAARVVRAQQVGHDHEEVE